MEGRISAAEANRHFSRLLNEVRTGHAYIITSHGTPVARIEPTDEDERVQYRARATLLERLGAASVTDVGRWSRDELYEDS